MKRLLHIASLLLTSVMILGQTPQANQRAEMDKLGWLIGSWKGSGWIQMGPQAKKEFSQTETIEARLEGLVLIIEGRGMSKEDGSLVHNALAFVSFDERTNAFRWRAFTHDGRQTDAVAKVSTTSLEWGLDIPQVGRMRYTLTLREDGSWYEVGEITRDGETWRKFFEMTLRKDK